MRTRFVSAAGRANVYSKVAPPTARALLQQAVRALGDQCASKAAGSDYDSGAYFVHITEMSERLSNDF